MTIKLRGGTILIPYSEHRAGKIYCYHNLQKPESMPYFVLSFRIMHKVHEPLIVIHVDPYCKDNVRVEKYRNSELVACYSANRYEELRSLPTKRKQDYLWKKLRETEIAQRGYLLDLRIVLRKVSNQKFLKEEEKKHRKNKNYRPEDQEAEQRRQRMHGGDFSPFVLEPVSEKHIEIAREFYKKWGSNSF